MLDDVRGVHQTLGMSIEVRSATEDVAEERSWRLHWWTQDQFRALAVDAGLVVAAVLRPDGRPAGASDTVFAFWLTAPG